MADETTTPTTGVDTTDSAAPTAAAPGSTPADKSTTDAPGFQKESFSDVLERVSTAKEPAKTEPTDDTLKPEESKEPVEIKPEKADLPPEAPSKEDAETDDEELELLSADEINSKFSNAPKGLRTYAAKIVEKFEPIAQVIDELGGIEAVKRLDKIQTIALGAPDLAEGGNVDQLHDQLKSLNPSMLEAFQHKLFYSAIDDPKDAETLLTPYIQADERYKVFTFSKLKEMADLVIDGHIDLDEVKERIAEADPKEADRLRLQAEKDSARDKELADLRKGQENAKAKDRQAASEQEVIRIRGVYEEKTAPVLKKFGLGKDFIAKDDPEDIQQVKQAYLDDLESAVSRRMYANPLVKDLAQRLGQDEKGDGYAWLVEKCANLYKGIVREEALKRSGLLSAFLKSYGKEVKETRRPEPDVDAATAARAKTTKSEEVVEPDRREGALGRLIEKHATSKVA